MSEHQIENLMKSAMNSIKDMAQVNTIVGETIKGENGVSIIPVSKVCLVLATGGTEFFPKLENKKNEKEEIIEYPFGGGNGTAVKISPIGFIVIDSQNISPKFIPVEHYDAVDKLLDYVPDLIEKVNKMLDKFVENTKESDDENETPKSNRKIEIFGEN